MYVTCWLSDTLDDEKLLQTNTSMQIRDVLLAVIRHLQNITRLHHASGGCVESTSTHLHSHRKVLPHTGVPRQYCWSVIPEFR